MKNWAGTFSFEPSLVLAPDSLETIQTSILSAINQKKRIRTLGSAHSWTGLVQTDQWLMHLDNYQGILDIDKANKVVHAKAGTKLHTFTHECHQAGYSLPNQGDVDKQSLAGATSTGTHGTGIRLQSMANVIEELTLVTGEGMCTKIKRGDSEFQAAALSLGTFGVVAELKLKMQDRYRLKVKSFPMRMEQVLEHIDVWLKTHRHVEMFYFPIGDWALVKIMDESSDEVTTYGSFHQFKEVVLENWAYEGFNLFAKYTGLYGVSDSIIRKFVSESSFVAWSHVAFPTERSVRFREMEYNLPAVDFKAAFSDIKKIIQVKKVETLFPIEIRFVKADDLWLSPASGRDSVYFAFHTYVKEKWESYFSAMEGLMKERGGRPHWGKWHSLKASDLEKVYPHYNDFLKLRKAYDPSGVFLNSHLEEMFRI